LGESLGVGNMRRRARTGGGRERDGSKEEKEGLMWEDE
jgi:hypothetical protein